MWITRIKTLRIFPHNSQTNSIINTPTFTRGRICSTWNKFFLKTSQPRVILIVNTPVNKSGSFHT